MEETPAPWREGRLEQGAGLQSGKPLEKVEFEQSLLGGGGSAGMEVEEAVPLGAEGRCQWVWEQMGVGHACAKGGGAERDGVGVWPHWSLCM